MKRIYLNLTNGLDSLASNLVSLSEARFIRIQSTVCEQKRWSKLIEDLDYDFLMSLALGMDVEIHDYSARKNVPRAIYQGVEFVRVATLKLWYDEEAVATVRGHDSTTYFQHEISKLSNDAKNKLRYFRKFATGNKSKFSFVAGPTKYDGNYDHYSEVLKGIKIE